MTLEDANGFLRRDQSRWEESFEGMGKELGVEDGKGGWRWCVVVDEMR
jgi:hypothetical protein